MAIEKFWPIVAPRLLLANGGSLGQLEVSSTLDFKVKQKIQLKSSTLPNAIVLEIKRINSDTEMEVGNPAREISHRQDVSMYLVADSAFIESPENQPRPAIPPDAYNRAVYDEEPTMADRVILVDALGNRIGPDNPLPIQSETPRIVIIDDASSTVSYFGFASPGSDPASPVWQIKKMVTTGTVTRMFTADGDLLFDNIWDNRASLGYI